MIFETQRGKRSSSYLHLHFPVTKPSEWYHSECLLCEISHKHNLVRYQQWHYQSFSAIPLWVLKSTAFCCCCSLFIQAHKAAVYPLSVTSRWTQFNIYRRLSQITANQANVLIKLELASKSSFKMSISRKRIRYGVRWERVIQIHNFLHPIVVN